MKTRQPAPSRQQTRPNAELDSQQGQRETRANVLTQREERWKANGMNNGEASLRIRSYAHSQFSPLFTNFTHLFDLCVPFVNFYYLYRSFFDDSVAPSYFHHFL
jgi:hypothetical protein